MYFRDCNTKTNIWSAKIYTVTFCTHILSYRGHQLSISLKNVIYNVVLWKDWHVFLYRQCSTSRRKYFSLTIWEIVNVRRIIFFNRRFGHATYLNNSQIKINDDFFACLPYKLWAHFRVNLLTCIVNLGKKNE